MRHHRRLGILAVAMIVAACSGAGLTSTTASLEQPATTATVPEPSTTAQTTPTTAAAVTVDPVAFQKAMRDLWTDHVAWTRLFIVSAVAGLPDTEATADRLLRNQADIGAAVAGFYGEGAGEALTALLRDHILLAGDLVTAAKGGDQDAISESSTAWYANADEISAFLAGANEAWPEETLRDMMHGHLDQTLAEATAQLTGDYAQSVAEYDHIVTHILEMADTLSAGIISQFPDRFSSPSMTEQESGLNIAMRDLWTDHVAWTRLFIVSAVAGLPDTEATADRLLRNQADIGAAVAGFYGEGAGEALTALLRDHILLAGDLVTAAKGGDQDAISESSTAWYANADEISAFLAGANEAWPEETLRDMMHGHLDQTLAEATAQLTGDYAQSVAEYDHIVTHILEMADTLSAGIISQFPDRF